MSYISKNCAEEYCSSFPVMHLFKGCNITNAFRGVEKIRPLKLLLKMPVYVPVFARIEESWNLHRKLHMCYVWKNPSED